MRPGATTSAATGAAAPGHSELVREHLPLVSYAVAEMASRVPSYVNRDDLVSAGMFGLVQAAQSYDAERGVEFGAFARVRIRGALIDELRSRDWATRSVRVLANKAAAATDELTSALGRTPTGAEVGARLGLDAAAVEQLAADVERACVVNYDSIVLGGEGESILPVAGADPEAQVLAREKCNYLYDAVATLPERMRKVVTASFYSDRPLAEIGAELGLTESRVSQIRSEALALLRDGMDAHLGAQTPSGDQPAGRVAKRKAAYAAAIASASDYRTRLDAGSRDVAERVALSGL